VNLEESNPGLERTFPHVFAGRAAAEPEAAALMVVTFVGGQPTAVPHTRRQLLDSAEHAADILVRLGVVCGDRVVLSLGDAARFLALFLGAQCIGAVPVPAPPFGDLPLEAYVERLSSIASDSFPRAVLVDDDRAAAVLASRLPAAAIVNVCRPEDTHEGVVLPIGFRTSRGGHEIAFLQYTSGSTGAPKGVVVLHRNLIANLEAIAEGARMSSADVMFSWLPLFHDMGLVAGLLLGLHLGVPAYVARSTTFGLRPEIWVRAIHQFRVTCSHGPNLAFNLLARRVADKAIAGLDLSSWRLAFDGAEVVDPETVREFVSRYASLGFAESGFRASYGLAEATLAVTFPQTGTPTRFDRIDRVTMSTRGVAVPVAADDKDAVSYTSVGQPIPGHAVRILDLDSTEEVPERHLGEIAVSGPSVSPGYFSELASGGSPRQELRTGDVGYMADGELYVVDRLKDVLVFGGRKFIPTDIERVLASIAGVRTGGAIAFSAPRGGGTDELYIVASLTPRYSDAKPEVETAIRDALRRHFSVAPAGVFFVRPGNLPKTSSGKLRRSACRALLEGGQLQGIARC
jgi:acyl-CoA synthetase (AMP-forming)/AMP-acid ligase II